MNSQHIEERNTKVAMVTTYLDTKTETKGEREILMVMIIVFCIFFIGLIQEMKRKTSQGKISNDRRVG